MTWARSQIAIVACALSAAGPAVAQPNAPLGAGTRALTLELDRASGRVAIGELVDQLVAPTLSATVAGGQLVLSPDLGGAVRSPTRWAITLVRLNRLGTPVARELPIIGHGLPPVAVLAPALPPGEHLRAQLEVDFGRFDGATSAAVVVPPLAQPLPASTSIATLSIDGKDARLPVDHPRMTFDLDVPATVTLRLEDARGSRWLRRAISAARVTRPTGRPVGSPVRVDPSASALRVAGAVVPLPSAGTHVRAAGAANGRAWAELGVDEAGVAWRVVFGWRDGRRATRFGVWPPPARVSVAVADAPAWVEVEQSTARGVRWTSPRVALGAAGVPEGLAWVARAGTLAGEVVRVGTSTGARVMVAVPEEL